MYHWAGAACTHRKLATLATENGSTSGTGCIPVLWRQPPESTLGIGSR